MYINLQQESARLLNIWNMMLKHTGVQVMWQYYHFLNMTFKCFQ